MYWWRTKILQCFKPKNYCPILLSVMLFGMAEMVKSQAPSPNIQGPAVRDRNRAMDEYDRTLNRMKNDARAVTERRRSLFPQINEDFQRIQVIHNEIVRMFQPDKDINYDRLAELTDDLKRRSARLRDNLCLPEPEKTDAKAAHTEAIDDSHMKNNIFALHDLVVDFVANPIFKNLGVVDAKMVDSATLNLNNLIAISDEIKREAKVLGKSAKK
jgi:hypothetical protein